jgi:hypothetical protein
MVNLWQKNLILRVAKIVGKCYYYNVKVKNGVEVVLPVKQGLKLNQIEDYDENID